MLTGNLFFIFLSAPPWWIEHYVSRKGGSDPDSYLRSNFEHTRVQNTKFANLTCLAVEDERRWQRPVLGRRSGHLALSR